MLFAHRTPIKGKLLLEESRYPKCHANTFQKTEAEFQMQERNVVWFSAAVCGKELCVMTQGDYLSSRLPPGELVNVSPRQTQVECFGFPNPFLAVCFVSTQYLPARTYGCTYADIITKFSHIDRFLLLQWSTK